MNLWSQVNKKECLSLAQRGINQTSSKKLSTSTASMSPFEQRQRKK